jgi:hypothetical protein
MTWEGIPSFHELEMELTAINNKLNNGRGVGAVRTVITYLKLCDLASAEAVVRNEFDKLRNYPEVVNWLRFRELLD